MRLRGVTRPLRGQLPRGHSPLTPSGPLVLGVAVDGLSPGRIDGEGRATRAVVERLDRDQREVVGGRPAAWIGVDDDAARVAAAREVEAPRRGPPRGAVDEA